MADDISIDSTIERLILLCEELEDLFGIETVAHSLQAVHSRLAQGEMHIAVIGQFNRGKSTFINRLIGIDLLPVSVLPLTAIPTEIRYGAESELIIQFATADEKRFSGTSEIGKALELYVTEEANPENSSGVERVLLTAPSSLLSHGTTIIDTPGFGSTHIHNTKATVELLKECDAVLFLLSADLPITQIELDFIKQITPHLSRIFFVYNKTDLLTDDELDVTSQFIKKTIQSQANILVESRFFPVSAKIAQDSREESGLHAIESEVLDFLQREKYFSLAEAIRSKLLVAKDELLSLIQNEICRLAAILEPLTCKIEQLDLAIAEVVEKMGAVAILMESVVVSHEMVSSVVRAVSERLGAQINNLTGFRSSDLQPLQHQLERELLSSAGQLAVDSLIRIHDRTVHDFGVTTIALPAVPLALFAEGIALLTTPSIWRSKESKRIAIHESLARATEQNARLFYEKITLLLNQFGAETATSVAETLTEVIDELRAKKHVIENERELIETSQKERTDYLQSIRSEIKAMVI